MTAAFHSPDPSLGFHDTFFWFSPCFLGLLFLWPPLKCWCRLRTQPLLTLSARATLPLISYLFHSCVGAYPKGHLALQVDMPTHMSKTELPPCLFPSHNLSYLLVPHLGKGCPTATQDSSFTWTPQTVTKDSIKKQLFLISIPGASPSLCPRGPYLLLTELSSRAPNSSSSLAAPP